MKDWLTYSVLSLLFFSLWGIFGKLATLHIKAQHAIIYETIGVIIITIFLLINYRFKIDVNIEGMFYSILVGITGIIGTLLYLLAMKKGNTAVVSFITALYPNIVLLWSCLFFKEPITIQQWIAILFAFISILLFTLS